MRRFGWGGQTDRNCLKNIVIVGVPGLESGSSDKLLPSELAYAASDLLEAPILFSLPGTGVDLMKARIAALKIFAILFLLLMESRADATQYSITGSIEQNNFIGGSPTYDFRLNLNKWLTSSNINENKLLEIISPGGQRVHEIAPTLDWVSAQSLDLSLADINSQIIGDWTFEETLGGITKRYEFTIPTIPSQMFTNPIPIITSPSDGDIVKKVFDVKWDNGRANQQSFRLGAQDVQGSPTAGPDIQRVGPGHARFSFANSPELGRIEITSLSTSVEVALHHFQLNPISSNADATLTSLDFLDWEIRSPAIAFTVIPEPASALLTCLAIISMSRSRGFLRR